MSDYNGSPLSEDFDGIASQLWEHNAKWWQDGFTDGADPEYEEQIIPLLRANLAGARSVLDIGTGEGQLARVASGSPGIKSVVGIDPTWEQVTVARERDAELTIIRAEASRIPLASSSFDTVIACLVFEHIDDLDGALDEVSRILSKGGNFLFFLNHPLMQTPGSGWIDDHIIGEQYWRIGQYLVEEKTIEEVEKDVYIPFIHRPLNRYINALSERGLFLVKMEEPAPPKGFLDKAPEYLQAASIPRLLFLRLEKR
ncbi:MAG: class I SAM-dependent methyltransferase [Actinobacteria bacterium]|nr:class I SAM-dependent methyltransferase [Actinomycetota bacterium]